MRGIIGSLALLLVCSAAFTAPARAAECGPLKLISSLPLTPIGQRGNVVTIPVKIGDSPRRLLVDTGAFQSFVTKRTVRELNLATTVAIGGAAAMGVAGTKSDEMAQLPSITIGNLR